VKNTVLKGNMTGVYSKPGGIIFQHPFRDKNCQRAEQQKVVMIKRE
jgi:hypothetical protein